jgi:hypothetical protein
MRGRMLRELGEHIQAARQRAAECKERALAATDEVVRTELLKLEQAWISLANNSESLQKMEEFLLDAHRRRGLAPNGC